MTCEEARLQIELYVDHELPAPETLAIEAHLMDCAHCRVRYETLRTVVDAVRGAGPLYQAPKESMAKVQALVTSHRRAWWAQRVLAGAAALLVLVFAGFVLFRPRSETAQFEVFATETHLRYARGLLPLDIASQQPQTVNGWLSTRLPFHLVLPDYPSGSAAKIYSLAGARLVQFRQEDVAFLAYRMHDRPISLLVASTSHITPSGGEVYRSGNVVFHISAEKGLSLITWADRGLTYALVSDLVVGGAASCVVCHGTEADREKLKFNRTTFHTLGAQRRTAELRIEASLLSPDIFAETDSLPSTTSSAGDDARLAHQSLASRPGKQGRSSRKAP